MLGARVSIPMFLEDYVMERAERDSRSNDEEARVIPLDALSRADQIFVRTEKSNYQVAMLDPSERKGMLTGGWLGDEIAEAFLGGTVSDDRTGFDSRELKTGARAVFFIRTKDHLHRLVTSL